MANGEKTELAIRAGLGGLQFIQQAIGATQKRNQAVTLANRQNRANLLADFNRARALTYRDDEMVRLHNYGVDRYNEYIPRAMTRAAQAYTDNNAVLKELIDQYQFAGQDRLRQSVSQRGALAARGITGRGAMTQDAALNMEIGMGDALMANNLLRARFGTQRANERIRQQLIDNMQSAYNKVGYTPRRTPGGIFNMTQEVKPAYTNNDKNLDYLFSVMDGVKTAFGGSGGTSVNNNVQPQAFQMQQLAQIPSINAPTFNTGGVGGTFRKDIPGIDTTDYKLPNFG